MKGDREGRLFSFKAGWTAVLFTDGTLAVRYVICEARNWNPDRLS